MNVTNRIFGWNAKAWNYPFLQALKDFPVPERAKILELGANQYSALSLFFLDSKYDLKITAYPDYLVKGLEDFVDGFKKSNENFNSKTRLSCMSIKKVKGKYDLILMKSVLGGVFGMGSSREEEAEKQIFEMVQKNLKSGGVLITLDNGKTVFEKLFSGFGARKKHWRFFVPSNFKKCTKQYTFGLLTNFSFVTRIGKMGQIFEDLFFVIDFVLGKMFKITKPSVIVSVYKKR